MRPGRLGGAYACQRFPWIAERAMSRPLIALCALTAACTGLGVAQPQSGAGTAGGNGPGWTADQQRFW